MLGQALVLQNQVAVLGRRQRFSFLALCIAQVVPFWAKLCNIKSRGVDCREDADDELCGGSIY